MLSDYYQTNTEEKEELIEEIEEEIKPINDRSEMEKITEKLARLEAINGEPVISDFEPAEFHDWIRMKTMNQEEAEDFIDRLLVQHSEEYISFLEAQVDE
jgi:polyhydroxyalkanoate synthesis regulator phasin